MESSRTRISEQEEAREPFHRLWIYGSYVIAADAFAWSCPLHSVA